MKDSEKSPVAVDFGMAPEQLSYICEYCGKVNPVVAAKCLRCGKRRPRSEYLKVMEKAKQQVSLREKTTLEMEQAQKAIKDAEEKQLVRLVEERVADEKIQIQAQQAILKEQEVDAVKRLTAREAAMRVIEAEERAERAIAGKARETEELLQNERERVLYAAAQKVVSERAGIEQAAEERINLARAELEKQSNRIIAAAVDVAEKDAARRAAMKVIASEQAAEDKIRLEREATQRMAFEKIKEEADRVSKYEEAKYQAQLEGIQRAAEERIRAEREYMEEQLGAVSPNGGCGQFPPAPVMPYGMPAMYGTQQPTTVQPLAIVPYLNDKQPVNQYNPQSYKRKLYKFVPDEVQPEEQVEEQADDFEEPVVEAPKKEKKVGSRILAVLSFLVTLAVAFFALYKAPVVGGADYINVVMTNGVGALYTWEGICIDVVTVLCLVNIVLTIIWICKGKGVKAGWIVPVLMLLDSIAFGVLVGMQWCTVMKTEDLYWFLGGAVLLFIFALIHYIGEAKKK